LALISGSSAVQMRGNLSFGSLGDKSWQRLATVGDGSITFWRTIGTPPRPGATRNKQKPILTAVPAITTHAALLFL
jgi:hypothetical protein